MKTVISSFVAHVERDYGATVASKFTQRFNSLDDEVAFGEAMNVLDAILGKPSAPTAPRSAATNSKSGKIIMKLRT